MGGFELIFGIVPVVVIVIFVMATSVRILRDYERAVIFRFGRRANAVVNPGGDGSGPGLVLLMPFIDKMVRVSLRTITTDVPPQDVITRDNVSVKVNAVIFFRVLDAAKAVISVQDYLYATSQMAQTTLRSVLGQQELDDLLASREKINQELTRIIDQHTNPWGVKVTAVEVKNVDLPQDMQRAMSKQAEAERERRAKVINAEGEFQAAAKLAEAAEVLSRYPIAVQLRYLQTMREVASERNTTTFFPLPIPWLEKAKQARRYEPRQFPFMNLGRVYLQQGHWWEALREFEGAVQLAPGDVHASKMLHQLRGRLN